MATEKALVFVIRANISDFNKALGDAERNFKKTFGNIKTELKNIATVSGGIAAAIVAPMALAFKDSAQYGEDIDNLSKKIGFNIEMTQRWANMMTVSGGSGDDLTVMVKKLSAAYDAAVSGTVKASEATDGLDEDLDSVVIGSDKASKAFAKLGINLADFGKLDTEGRLRAIFVALSKIKDKNEQQSIVGALLGKGGQKALIAASGDVEAFLAKMDVMSQETIDKLKAAKEASELFEIAWKNAVGTVVAATFGGDATKGIETLTEKLKEFSKWVSEHPEDAKRIVDISLAVAGLAIAVGTLAGVAFTIVQVAGAFGILKAAWIAIGLALSGGGFSGAIAISLGVIGNFLASVGTAIATFIAGLGIGLIGALVAAVVAWGWTIWLIVTNWDVLKAANWGEFFTNLGTVIVNNLALALQNIRLGFEQAKNWVIQQWNAVVTWFQNLPAAIQAALVNVWNFLTQPFRDAWAEIQRVADQIANAWNNLFSGGNKTVTINANLKPPGTYATGGIFNRPTLGIIGEAGPEAVIPLNRLAGMGGGLTVNVGSFMGDEISLREFTRRIQRIYNEETRRSSFKPTETSYYSPGGHL